MPATPATAAHKARRDGPTAAVSPGAGPPAKPGRVRRFFQRLDEGMQLVDAVVAVGRAAGLAVRGVFHVFKLFD